ncbi:MAG: nucleotidyltransferase substrate binding protein [Rhodospirillales bacterium]
MDRLAERLEIAARALSTLDEVITADLPATVRRDAAIIRLVYTFEAVWKAAQRFLADVEGIERGTPNGVIRGCRDAGLLSAADTESALAITRDRNLSVHIYNEALAEQIFARLPDHVRVLGTWLGAMRRPRAAGPDRR